MNGSILRSAWFRAASTLLVVFVASTLVPSTSQAGVANKSKIYVFPYQGVFKGVPKEITVQTSDLIKNEIKHSDDVQLQKGPIFIPESVASKIKPLDDKALKKAQALQAKGEKAYAKLKLAVASKSFRGALARYERSVALLTDFSPLLDSMLMLSVCYYRMDKEDEGAKMLVKVIRIKPDIVLDAEKYPPMFRNTLDKIRKRLLRKTRGEAEVVANIEGATVFFDGRKVGATPVILKELVPGEHYVRVEKEGLQSWAGKVVVVSTKKVRILATLGGVKKASGPIGEIAEALRINNITPAILKTVQAQGKEIGADFVILGGVAMKGQNFRVGSFMVRVKDKQLCPLPEIEFDPDLLGASVEVYNMAAIMFKRVEGCPDPVGAKSVSLVQTAKKKKAEVKAVAVGPAVPPPDVKKPDPKPAIKPAVKPAVGPATPATGPARPATGPARPATGPARPATGPARPATGPARPATGPARPATGPARPATGPATPGAAPARPTTGPAAPATPAAKPVVAGDTGLVTTGGSALNKGPRRPLVVPTAPGANTLRPIDEIDDGGDKWYKAWWFWTVVGVVVVGGTVGAVGGMGGFDSSDSGGSVTVHWPR
ncbi:MAG: PEGA domain-containing protein [Deltaproteobacteria bacterium]|nr:PEGA domain-containing protein [Deltaproteobacteria bacterium]